MFELIVTDFIGVQQYVDKAWPTKIISALARAMPDYGPNHLRVQFSDIHKPMVGYIAPSIQHLQQVLEFTRELTDDDRVLVHCWAGMSRSTALAIAILIQHGMSFQDAFQKIAEQRPMLCPNEMLVEFIDDLFDLHGEFIEMIKQHEQSFMINYHATDI